MKRCFIAVLLPQEAIKRLIKIKHQMINVTKKLDARIKWVEDENIHLTLKFLGNVNDEDIERIKEVLRDVAKSKREISCEIHKVGFFPNERFPRVIWLGVESNNKLEELAKEVNVKLNKFGFGMENNFVAHITLGRVKFGREKRKIGGVIKHVKFSPIAFEVREIALVESLLKPSGPEYRVIEKRVMGG